MGVIRRATHIHSHSHVLVNLHIFDIYVFANMLVEIVVYGIYNISYIYIALLARIFRALFNYAIYMRVLHIYLCAMCLCVCGASLMHNAIHIGKYIQSIYPYPIYIYIIEERERKCVVNQQIYHIY